MENVKTPTLDYFYTVKLTALEESLEHADAGLED